VPAAAGVAAAYLLGGLCARLPGWKGAFAGVGAALLVVAAYCLRAPEPARSPLDRWATLRAEGVVATLRRLLSDRGRLLGLAAAVLGAGALGALGFWLPAYLVRVRNTPFLIAGGELAAMVVAGALAGAALGRAGVRALAAAENAPRWVAAGGAGVAGLGLSAALAWSAPAVVLPALMIAFLGVFAAAYGAMAAVTARAGADPGLLALSVLLVHGLGELSGAFALGALADRATFGKALILLPAAFLASGALWAAAAMRRTSPAAVGLGGRDGGGGAGLGRTPRGVGMEGCGAAGRPSGPTAAPTGEGMLGADRRS
jgi:MFS transporter, Spinster family, sphingosine-1-phosphate transporter